MSYKSSYTGEKIDEGITKALSSVQKEDVVSVYDEEGTDPVNGLAVQDALNKIIVQSMSNVYPILDT